MDHAKRAVWLGMAKINESTTTAQGFRQWMKMNMQYDILSISNHYAVSHLRFALEQLQLMVICKQCQ
jgi:hypothetical protein